MIGAAGRYRPGGTGGGGSAGRAAASDSVASSAPGFDRHSQRPGLAVSGAAPNGSSEAAAVGLHLHVGQCSRAARATHRQAPAGRTYDGLFVIVESFMPVVQPIRTVVSTKAPPCLSRIVLTIDPTCTPAEVADHYRRVRGREYGRLRRLTEKHAALAVFRAEQPGERISREQIQVWNSQVTRRQPGWRYKQLKLFIRDAETALERLLDPGRRGGGPRGKKTGQRRGPSVARRSPTNSAARRPLIVERRALLERFQAAPKRSKERREFRQQLDEIRTRWRGLRTTLRLTEPKSARSRRTIQMPCVVSTALKVHRRRQLEERLTAAGSGAWNDAGLVFTSPIGTPIDPRNATRAFHTVLKATSGDTVP